MMTRIEIYIERKDKTVISGDAEIDNVYKDEMISGSHYIGEYDFTNLRVFSDLEDEVGRELSLSEHDYVYEYIIERAIEEGTIK